MNPTASSLERGLECPGSVVIEGVFPNGNAYTYRGTSIHGFARRVIRGLSVSDALQHVAESHRKTCEKLDFAKLTEGLTDLRSENAFAIDSESLAVRFLGEDIGRAYPLLAGTEFAGTEDLGAVRSSDNVIVTTDFKSGFLPVTECRDNAQIKFFSLRAHLATGAPTVLGRIAYIREDGGVRFDEHLFTRGELEDFADDLSALVARIAAARAQYERVGSVDTSPGPWCRYCPAVSACPSKIALARSALTDLPEIQRGLKLMTPEEKGKAWVKAKELETLLEIVIEGLKDCAIQEPYPTRGGEKMVKASMQSRSSFVQAKAIELLHQLGATRAQIDALYGSTTFPVVREVNVPKLPKERRPRKVRAA